MGHRCCPDTQTWDTFHEQDRQFSSRYVSLTQESIVNMELWQLTTVLKPLMADTSPTPFYAMSAPVSEGQMAHLVVQLDHLWRWEHWSLKKPLLGTLG